MSKIFFIDNDIYLSRLYERVFRVAGHHIETAQDSLLALERLKEMESLPDVILMDLEMPKMTGLDLFQRIHAFERTKDIPIIVFTNSVKKEAAQKFVELGATMYLMKMEHDPKAVVQKVEEIISAKK